MRQVVLLLLLLEFLSLLFLFRKHLLLLLLVFSDRLRVAGIWRRGALGSRKVLRMDCIAARSRKWYLSIHPTFRLP